MRSARGGGAFGARTSRGLSRAKRASASLSDATGAPDFPEGSDGNPVACGPADIRRAAFTLLGRREYCTAELRARLGARFHDEAAIDAELERLISEGLLDDTRFVEAFIRMHRRKGHGPQRVLHELQQRGVDAELAERIVDPRGDDWIELARSLRERRFGAAVPSGAEWQRQARHLQTRGFSTEQVRRAMRAAED